MEIYTQPCPGLVEAVESGRWGNAETETLLGRYLDKLLANGVDTIILGCTHYPFLRPMIEKIVGCDIKVIDSGVAVARQVVRVLEKKIIAANDRHTGSELFFTSGDPEIAGPVMRLLWGKPDLVVSREEF